MLQHRKKWQQYRGNLKESEILLLRDKTHHRNDLPVWVILNITYTTFVQQCTVFMRYSKEAFLLRRALRMSKIHYKYVHVFSASAFR